MAVHKHQPLSGRSCYGFAYLVKHPTERYRRQRDGSRFPGVFVGLSVRQRRQQPQIEVFTNGFDNFLRYPLGNGRVAAER